MVDKSILQWGRIALLGAAGSLAALTGWTTPAKADIIIHFTGTTDSGTNDTANYFGGITGIQTVNGVLTISPDGLTDACGGGGSCFRSGTNINSSWTINGITVSTSSAGTVNGLVNILDTSNVGGGSNNLYVSTTDGTIKENLAAGFDNSLLFDAYGNGGAVDANNHLTSPPNANNALNSLVGANTAALTSGILSFIVANGETITGSLTSITVEAPEPASMLLLGSGVFATLAARRRRR